MSRVGGPVVLVAVRVVATSTFVADIFGCPFDAAALQRLAAFNSDADCLQVNDREQHALLRQCQSVSALSNGVFDGALRRRATFRGIGTLHKIVTTLGANRDAAMPPCRHAAMPRISRNELLFYSKLFSYINNYQGPAAVPCRRLSGLKGST